MKKTEKALATLAIAGMMLMMVPLNVFAAGTIPTRLAGTTAAQTAVAIADQTGWTGTAILASSESYGMVDALTAGPLASYLKAPILLTGDGNVLDAATKAELIKLAVTKVYVTSGTAVIKQSVIDELVTMGIAVEELGGFDKFETSVNIAAKMVGVTKVAVANGLQDALSIAAIASAANEPILLTNKDVLPASVKAYLDANHGITASDVIGGTGVISDVVKLALPNASRHYGNTAYDTNYQVIQDFASSLTFDQVYLANGVTGIDALAGAPLAAQTKSAIVLTDGTVPAAATFVNTKLTSNSVVSALGGAAVVPDSVIADAMAKVDAEAKDKQVVADKVVADAKAKVDAELKAKQDAADKVIADAKAAEDKKVADAKAVADKIIADKAAAEKAEKEAINNRTLSQKNAIRQAEEYLDYTAFSESGLIKQLEYEGFSKEDAIFGVKNIKVDWKEQAVKQAESYLDYSSFSRSGLIEQLVYGGHSRENANYAATQVGF